MEAQGRGRGVRRLGVMGGTFDPIHVGHLVAGSEALHAYELDLVIFMPASRPWQKSSYADAEDRFMMAMLAASTDPGFAVSRLELDRHGPTYTVETMATLRQFYGRDVALFFILGADALAKLDTWHRFEGLSEVTELVAITRSGYDIPDPSAKPSWPVVHVMDMPAIDISSTDIRQRVKAGRPIDHLVAPEVAAYIREHGLYVGDEQRDAS